ncbi:hypothetical protein Tco_1376825 [Tanacetum coccineum]
MEDGIYFNQSKYIKEMLKKFGLEDSKPTKTPMSMEIKLTKDDEADSVDNSKYRENSKTTHLEVVKRIFRAISLSTKVAFEDNIADIFTKTLKREVFNYLRLGLGMMELIMDSDPSSSQK